MSLSTVMMTLVVTGLLSTVELSLVALSAVILLPLVCNWVGASNIPVNGS